MRPFAQVLPMRQALPDRMAGEAIGLANACERVFSAVVLLALTPGLIFIALVILVLSRRSPLIRHARVGRYGAPLPLLKFRTMWSENDNPARMRLTEDVDGAIPEAKTATDPRVSSRFARLCRRYSVDELPQLWHVVRGEMSLVGPRPVTAGELAQHYGAAAAQVLEVRPGLAGLWQVMGRSRLSYRQRRRLDLFLVGHASYGLYLRILAKTLPAVLKGRDAY
jgi:lipopolysaccharide/colanic/teichoic acid biosynthesis glycosyltransferase